MPNASGTGAAAIAPSRDAAFVVHLANVADDHGKQACGRVEHVRTGRTARFESVEELLRFMRQTLAALNPDDGSRERPSSPAHEKES